MRYLFPDVWTARDVEEKVREVSIASLNEDVFIEDCVGDIFQVINIGRLSIEVEDTVTKIREMLFIEDLMKGFTVIGSTIHG